MRLITLHRFPISMPISSVRAIHRFRLRYTLVRLILLIGIGLVFPGMSGCAPDFTLIDEPFVTVTPVISPTPTHTPAPTPTRTQIPTPTPEFPGGSATILHMQGLMSVQVAGEPIQAAEPGLTMPASGGTLLVNSGISQLKLNDGTLIHLGDDTTVSLVSVAGLSGSDTVIQIQQGIILVGANQLTIEASTTQFANLFQAQVTNGWMGVTYEPETEQFLVDCLTGSCQVDDLTLSEGQRVGFTGSILGLPGAVQYDFWQALVLFDALPPTATVTITSTPTPSRTPTPPSFTSVPPTLAPTNTPQDEPPNPPPPTSEPTNPPPPPEPTETATSVPIPTDTPTSVSPP